MLLHTWLPGALRAAGISVVETAGWTSRSHGAFPAKVAAIWHHDASPPGDSPGTLDWMISNWPNSSANVWVNRYGTWHLVGTGVSWHAGDVLPGMPGNFDSIGIETDHTTGEDWPPALLESLQRGTAALLEHQGLTSASLHFHKTVCEPPGRKVDPDGLDLGTERRQVADLISGTPTTPPEDDDVTDDDIDKIATRVWQYMVGNGGAGATLEEVRATNRDINAKVSKLCDPRNGNVDATG